MGLREKVALLILIDFFVQVMYGQYVQHTNKLISPYQVPYTKYKVRKKAIPIQRPIAREGCVAKIFNFPEVEYGLASTPTNPLYSNHNFDLNHQLPKMISTPSKYSIPSTNEPQCHEYKNNHRNSITDGRKAKKKTLPKTASVPNTCLNNELFFPSVDYPLDVKDLWTPHYWNRIPQMQPETKLDSIDFTINTKKKKAKVAKGPRKESKMKTKLNSCTDTKTNNKTEPLTVENNTKIKQNACIEFLTKKESFIPICTIDESKQCITDHYPDKNKSEKLQEIINSQTEHESHKKIDEIISPATCVINDQNTKRTTDQDTIGQVTPTNLERPYSLESTSTKSIVSFLTTVAPTLLESTDNIIENSVITSPKPISLETCNSTEVENDLDSELPDDMGYTIMYPEQFGSASTSTMSPFDENIDNAWMYPEFDNHTFNSYSDEVEQCYILVP